jgi:hypothetical protein
MGLFILSGVFMAKQILEFPWPMMPAVLIFIAVFYVMTFGIKCPGCRRSLFGCTWVVGGRLFSVGKRMRFCPRCGIDFDSEIR